MASTEPLLRMEQIDKRFPGVYALDHVDFDLYAGEVHVLLGENGAGKSTLVKILSGSIPRDSGRIIIQGKEIQHLTPAYSQELSIGMVYQELSLVPALTVAENIFLGQLPRNNLGIVDWSKMVQQARESLAKLGVAIDPRIEVRKLDVAEQQLTEIARVLTREPKILLLDEPTSALSGTERARLFEIIDLLRRRGVGIVYISHHLDEVPLVGQRVTVLRDGCSIGTLPVEEARRETLISMMVGRKLTEQYPKKRVVFGEVGLQIDSLSIDGKLKSISLELREGEILGIFGLMGAGQAILARAIFGLEPLSDGRIYLRGQEIAVKSPSDAIHHGLGFLTRDRRILKLKAEKRTASTYVRDLRIQPSALDRAVVYLSGGNQQKVVLARWLFSEARFIIFDEPTRGIDVGGKAEVFSLMEDLTKKGVGIIMISSEMPEILAMADRILVMRAGCIAAEYRAGEATQEMLLQSAS
jgi:ribose transport system ATP-binding protein